MATNISTIVINAPVEKVWGTLTDAALVKQWQYGSDVLTDWKVGSSIRFVTRWQDKVFEQWGTVLAMRPLELIQYNLFAPRPNVADEPGNYFIMNYVLTPVNDQTKLEIIQEDNRPGAVQEAPQGEENAILQLLKKVAETN